MHSIFKFRKKITPEILSLLKSTTLGTTGARYSLTNFEERIAQLENAEFLSLERNNKVLANITFSNRGENKFRYIRYFSFRNFYQAHGHKASRGEGFIKREMHDYFEGNSDINIFYAYIEEANSRSKLMAKQFGFNKAGQVLTQTFTRKKAKASSHFEIMPYEEIRDLVENNFGNLSCYSSAQHKNGHWGSIVKEGKILAFAHFQDASWKIHQLPGKFGKLQTKLIPFIPVLRTFVKPNKHEFLTVDSVWALDTDKASTIEELFSSILAHEKKKIIHWWVDTKNDLYQQIANNISWGIIDKIVGRKPVDLFALGKNKIEGEHYISGTDFC
jgi:hypothetical protein